jgi:uncharacterized repeat protein (TIGR01451 family)
MRGFAVKSVASRSLEDIVMKLVAHPRRATRHAVAAVAALAVAVMLAAWVTDLRAATRTVTVTITRIVELHCDEGLGEACPNDYYPEVSIGDNNFDDSKDKYCCAHGTDILPNWTFSHTLDTSENPISIDIELWDQDDAVDDQLDIANGPSSLNLQLNLTTCTWTGGGLQGTLDTQSSSQGSGDDSAKIYFTIHVSDSDCDDSDEDGLLDAWEKNGYDVDGDGTAEVDLPGMGAKPGRKDLFLEVDYLGLQGGHAHAPLEGAVRDVVQAFANAPVANPDGSFGIQLHVDVGNIYGAGTIVNVAGTEPNHVTGTYGDYGGGGQAFDESGSTIVDYDGNVGDDATNFFVIKSMNTNRDNIFRYALFVHQTNSRRPANDCTSGLAKGIPGVNFFVSLGGVDGSGNACWTADGSGQSLGSRAEQAGTLMHEFGHVIGLGHGGGDGLNNKPNYLSVMNYSFQQCTVPAEKLLFGTPGLPGGCDYSRYDLPQAGVGLNENALDECRGIADGFFGFGGVDWNGDGTLQGATCGAPNTTNVLANINNDTTNDTNKNGSWDPGEPTRIGTLNGYNDWQKIVYNFRTVFDFTTAGAPSSDEPDREMLEKSEEFLTDLVRPSLTADKSGPADARPGDTLTYTITVTNPGHGPALGVAAVDTKPDLTTQTFTIGSVAVGASIANTLSYAVACSVKDGTVLTNSVQATGVDLLSHALTSGDSVQTTIHAPVLTLSKTATATVNAGEAITYTVRYENTGSGSASDVTIVDTLPAGIYYSVALDQAPGIKPTSVTLNNDGTRTLRWSVGTVAGNSGPQTVSFTARPTLLALGGTQYTNQVTLGFSNENGCQFSALQASASTTITTVPATLDPLTIGFWRTHPELYAAELLARIQATDQRYDRPNPNGSLSIAEVTAAFQSGGSMPYILEQQLLATYFNLATRRVNAATVLRSKLAARLGLAIVRDAGLFGVATLALPVSPATATQYSNANNALDEINTGKSIR